MPPYPPKPAYKTANFADEHRVSQFIQDLRAAVPTSSAPPLPDEKKRFTQLFQEIESIIGEMNPRSDEDIRMQMERHGIIPRVRHSIDMSVAEWKSIRGEGTSARTANGSSENAQGLHLMTRSVAREASKNVKTGAKVKASPASAAAPPVPDKKPTLIGDKFKIKASRNTTDGASSSSSNRKFATSSSTSSAKRPGHTRAPSAPMNSTTSPSSHSASGSSRMNSKSVDMRGSKHKPLPPLPFEVRRHGQIFRYSELVDRVLEVAPRYISDRSRKAFSVIAQDIDWWDVWSESEEVVVDRLPSANPKSVEDQDARLQRALNRLEGKGEGRRTQSVSRSASKSAPASVVRPEENTTLKQANEVRALQRAASLNATSSVRLRAEAASRTKAEGGGRDRDERYLYPRTKD